MLRHDRVKVTPDFDNLAFLVPPRQPDVLVVVRLSGPGRALPLALDAGPLGTVRLGLAVEEDAVDDEAYGALQLGAEAVEGGGEVGLDGPGGARQLVGAGDGPYHVGGEGVLEEGVAQGAVRGLEEGAEGLDDVVLGELEGCHGGVILVPCSLFFFSSSCFFLPSEGELWNKSRVGYRKSLLIIDGGCLMNERNEVGGVLGVNL